MSPSARALRANSATSAVLPTPISPTMRAPVSDRDDTRRASSHARSSSRPTKAIGQTGALPLPLGARPVARSAKGAAGPAGIGVARAGGGVEALDVIGAPHS